MVDISIIVLSIIQVGDHIRYYKNDQIQVNAFSTSFFKFFINSHFSFFSRKNLKKRRAPLTLSLSPSPFPTTKIRWVHFHFQDKERMIHQFIFRSILPTAFHIGTQILRKTWRGDSIRIDFNLSDNDRGWIEKYAMVKLPGNAIGNSRKYCPGGHLHETTTNLQQFCQNIVALFSFNWRPWNAMKCL